jgi:uncharacterized protein (TIGR02145 family)
MKKKYIIAAVPLLILVIFFACKREEGIVLPEVITASVDEIYNTSAKVGGRVANNGGPEISDRGVYWGTSEDPEKGGTKLGIGTGNGIFYENISGLTPGVKYYVKAYANNGTGESFGQGTFFTTQISLPTVETSDVTEFTPTSVRLGGAVTDNGGFEVTQRGVYWGTEPDPRLKGTKLIIGSGDGSFSQTVTGLSRAKTYYAIAFATNLKGASYGREITFSTEPELPVVVTGSIFNINPFGAEAGGVVTSSGGLDVTERGFYWGTSPNPVLTGTKLAIGIGTGSFTSQLTSLNPAIRYYVKAYAINSMGIAYGEEKSFLTKGEKPVADTATYSDLGANSVVLTAIVRGNDLSTSVTFEYGETASYGTSVVGDISPVFGRDTVKAVITGLDPLKTYHFRAAVENVLGTDNSNDAVFTTYTTGVTGLLTDSEGNGYHTIGIGYQVWMTENLRSVVYKNGSDSIPLVKNDSVWASKTTAAFCWFDNNSALYKNEYGALYNWYAVETGNLCPAGWRVPTNEDISALVDFLKGAGIAGGSLKEKGTLHWNSPNSGATDKFGFSARGGGRINNEGVFDFMKVEGNWWTSSSYGTYNATYLNLLFNYPSSFQSYTSKKTGMSVRCIRDN